MTTWRMGTCKICFMTCHLEYYKGQMIGAQIHGKKKMTVTGFGMQDRKECSQLGDFAIKSHSGLPEHWHFCIMDAPHRSSTEMLRLAVFYLDYNLEPRLSNFGLAKICGSGLDEEIALCSPGYAPPEFSQPEFDASVPKSDVYCFGVVLFELLTGKKPVGDDYPDEKEASLVSWVRGLVRKNKASRAIDPKIRDTGAEVQMEEALKIGYLCTADLPSKRPSMQQIVGLLKDIKPSAN